MNQKMMGILPSPDTVLRTYVEKLNALKTALPTPSPQAVLDVLIARDAVQHVLNNRSIDDLDLSVEQLNTLEQLDEQLKKQSKFFIQYIHNGWRASLNPNRDAWWWFFDKTMRSEGLGRFYRFWGALTLIILVVAIALGTSIFLQLVSTTPDTLTILAVILDIMISALIAGGTLTLIGRQAIARLLAGLGIPEQFWIQTRLILAFVLFLGLLAFQNMLPDMANYYNNRGLAKYELGQWIGAQNDFNRAIKLYPDYAEAHYNLGLLYEDLSDFDRAQAEYQIATANGLDAGYNNLAHLYIMDGNNARAIPLLLNGLDRVTNDEVKYDLLKNIGWIRLKQDRYSESKTYLQTATNLFDNKAPAHCLLAQALEAQGDDLGSLYEWENCLKFANGRNPEEDTWINMAQQHLLGDE